MWLLGLRRRRSALKYVEQFQREIVAARGEFANLVAEGVVSNYRRNGRKQAGRGGDEGLGNARRYRPQGGGARSAQSLKGVNNAPHRAEQPDKRRDRAGGGQPGEAALQTRHLFRSRNLSRALNGGDVARRASALPAV